MPCFLILCLVLLLLPHKNHAIAQQSITAQEAPTQSAIEPTDEQRLMHLLFNSYEKAVRPVFKASSTPSIAVGLTITHIFEVHEKQQYLAINAWLEQEWIDERFFWNPDMFGQIQEITLPAASVWLPDIVLMNNAVDFSQGFMQVNVKVSSNGLCLWVPPEKFRALCKLDVTFFPFDLQVCQLRFGSWMYNGFQLNLTLRSENINMDSYTDNGGWEIVSTKALRHVNYHSCCQETPYPEIRFQLHLKRRTLYYMYNIVSPCVMLSVLVIFEFRLPCDSNQKVTLGLAIVLAYSVYCFKIVENMPETSDVVPLLAIYVICNMSLSIVSIFLSVIVLYVHHQGAYQRPVPRMLKTILQDYLAPLIGYKIHHVPHGIMEALAPTLQPLMLPAATKVPSTNSGTQDSKKNMLNRLKELQQQVLQDAVNELLLIKKQMNAQQQKARLAGEWRQVAEIIDRFCFWVALLCTGALALCTLVVAPLFSKGTLYVV